jgi:alkanesulfonate monooxygenase SsuD/methylene tetrahydromethanopterin reductase-like flavin-dependent oxidoreductase (luciferase family)
MTMGISFTSRSRLGPIAFSNLAEYAENCGIDWIFINESGNDSLVMATIIANSTSRIKISTGITNIYLRHPILTAAGSLEIAEKSKGRFALGLGTGHRSINEIGLGIKMVSPLAQLKEYFYIVRKCLNEGKIDFEGNFYRVKNYELMLPKRKFQIPIYMATLGLKSAYLAGQIADGVILNFATPEHVREVAEALRKGAIDAGRQSEDLKIICYLHTIIITNGKEKIAIKTAKRTIADYSRLSFYRAMFAKIGFPIDESKLLSATNEDKILETISDDLVKNVMLVGTATNCKNRIEEYYLSGVHIPVIYPTSYQGNWEEVIGELIDIYSSNSK